MELTFKPLTIVLSINEDCINQQSFTKDINKFININFTKLYNLIIVANKVSSQTTSQIATIIGGLVAEHNFVKAYLRKQSNYVGHGFSYAIANAQKLLKSKYVLFLNIDDNLNEDFWGAINDLDNKDLDFLLYSSLCKNQQNVNFKNVVSKNKGKQFPLDCKPIFYNVNFLTSKLDYYFEDYYKDFMSHMFLINSLEKSASGEFIHKDVLVPNSNKILNRKRINDNISKLFFTKTPDMNGLSAIIAFRNENSEVERTIKSIRWTTKNLNIMLIDDCSDDNYDYEKIADLYHCEYIKNEKRIGSAGSKNKGGYLCKTPYFCFFDAHMRLYKQDWDKMCIGFLQKHPNAIISSRTCYMSLTDADIDGKSFVKNECSYGDDQKGVSWCCYISMNKGYSFDPKWTNEYIDKNNKNKLSPVACVLGACYAIKTDWWKTIGGFNEIQQYGLEESLMSIKTWLYGGECFVVKDWGVGHLYRNVNPNPVSGNDIDANRLSLINFFYHNDEKTKNQLISELKNRIGEHNYKQVCEKYKDVEKIVEQNAEDFWKNKTSDRTMKWFFANVNNKVCPENEKN